MIKDNLPEKIKISIDDNEICYYKITEEEYNKVQFSRLYTMKGVMDHYEEIKKVDTAKYGYKFNVLVVRDGNEMYRKSFIITNDMPLIKIGSDKNADILITEKGISRMHSVIEYKDANLTIIDLGSDVGTIINGAKVNKKTLIVGDIISVGNTTIHIL